MPSYHDPLGNFDHLKPKPYEQAKADYRKTIIEGGFVMLQKYIQCQQAEFITVVAKLREKEWREAEFLLQQAVREEH